MSDWRLVQANRWPNGLTGSRFRRIVGRMVCLEVGSGESSAEWFDWRLVQENRWPNGLIGGRFKPIVGRMV
ncbi:MAG: hypothetical protein ACEPOZ_15365 [Marinifilaceae bacterium]